MAWAASELGDSSAVIFFRQSSAHHVPHPQVLLVLGHMPRAAAEPGDEPVHDGVLPSLDGTATAAARRGASSLAPLVIATIHFLSTKFKECKQPPGRYSASTRTGASPAGYPFISSYNRACQTQTVPVTIGPCRPATHAALPTPAPTHIYTICTTTTRPWTKSVTANF